MLNLQFSIPRPAVLNCKFSTPSISYRKMKDAATCTSYDAEMKKRVERHQRERSEDWYILEVIESERLPEAMRE